MAEVLATLSRSVSRGDLEEAAVLRSLTELASVTLDVSRVGIWLFNNDGEQLVCRDLFCHR